MVGHSGHQVAERPPCSLFAVGLEQKGNGKQDHHCRRLFPSTEEEGADDRQGHEDVHVENPHPEGAYRLAEHPRAADGDRTAEQSHRRHPAQEQPRSKGEDSQCCHDVLDAPLRTNALVRQCSFPAAAKPRTAQGPYDLLIGRARRQPQF